MRKKKQANLKSEVAEFKRQRILEEAVHLFYQVGYEAATLDAVAAKLDVTKPLIYGYFKNKGELLYAICESGIQLSLQELNKALDVSGSNLDKLKQVVHRVAHVVLEYQEYIVVYVREEKNLSDEDSLAIRKLRSKFDHQLAEFIQQGVEQGEFNATDPLITATTIGGMVSWLAFWFNDNGAYTGTEVIQNINQLIIKMLQSP